MIKTAWVAVPAVCLLAMLTRAQAQPSGEIATLPMGRGVYYESPSGWTSLPFTIVIPSTSERGWTLEPSTTIAEVRGPYPEMRLSTLTPTLYLRGISPGVGIYLVREIQQHNYRKLRMDLRRDDREWAHFIDTIPFDVEPLTRDIVRIRPRESLPAGVYTLATGFETGSRWIFLGFEFGITADARH
ncbi:MAG TPA: hypothetical protein VGQ49_00795 [Bryobacteraceae bacterium]|nr:hypothetical protein [Bryobacteraceae bacterium]